MKAPHEEQARAVHAKAHSFEPVFRRFGLTRRRILCGWIFQVSDSAHRHSWVTSDGIVSEDERPYTAARSTLRIYHREHCPQTGGEAMAE